MDNKIVFNLFPNRRKGDGFVGSIVREIAVWLISGTAVAPAFEGIAGSFWRCTADFDSARRATAFAGLTIRHIGNGIAAVGAIAESVGALSPTGFKCAGGVGSLESDS